MARQWVVNNASGARMIGGLLLQPGEGTWVEGTDFLPAAPSPQLRTTLTAAQVAKLAADGMPVAPGILLVDPVTGQLYGQSDGAGSFLPLGSGLASTCLAISSGSDLTAMVLDGANILRYTAAAKWLINRDGSGIPASLAIDGGTTGISSTLTRVGSSDFFVVSAGVENVSARLTMTVAQMRTLEAAVLAGDTTLKAGFAVFCIDAGSITTPAGVTYVPGATATWCPGIGFLWDEGVIYRNDQAAAYTGSTSISAALQPLTIPANVMGPIDTVLAYFKAVCAGLGGIKTFDYTINGNTSPYFFRAASLAANIEDITIRKSLRNRGVTTSQDAQGQGNQDTTATSTSTQALTSINTKTTALLFEPKVTPTALGDTFTAVRHVLIVNSREAMT